MPITRTTSLVLVVLALSSSCRGEEVPDVFEAKLRLLMLEVNGTVSAGEGHGDTYVMGDSFNVREDLGVLRGPWVSGEARLYLGAESRLEAHLFHGRAPNRKTVDQGFDFNGEFHYVGERLKEEISLGMIAVGYDHRIFGTDDFTMWAGIGLMHHSVNVEIDIDRSIRQHKDLVNGERIKGIVPYFHFDTSSRVARNLCFLAEVRVGAFSLPWFLGEPGEVRFAHLTAGLEWRPTPWICVEVGGDFLWDWSRYYGRELSGTPDMNKDSLILTGPYVGVSIRF